MSDTIVFAGPSISRDEILSILPDAMIHEPVRCQDVYRAMRLAPKRMIIIDGYYETGLSVWHKEILQALSSGIEVIGAASMGALRASELAHFGMIGIGRIFNWYQDGVIDGDDEVAVLHGDAAMGYPSYNLALVDIRATIEMLVKQKRISIKQHDILLKKAQDIFYPYRKNYECIIDPNDDNSEAMLAMLKTNHMSLKKQDAIEALKYARAHKPIAVKQPVPVHLTLYYVKMCMECNTSAFRHNYSWLPDSEKQLIKWLHSKQKHVQCAHEYARCLNHAYRIMIAKNIPHEPFWLKTRQWVMDNKKNIDAQQHALLESFFAIYFYKSNDIEAHVKPIISAFVDVLILLVHLMNENHFHIAGDDYNQFRDFILKNRLGIQSLDDLTRFSQQFNISEEALNECIDLLTTYYIGYKSLHMIPTNNILPIPSQNWLYTVLSLF